MKAKTSRFLIITAIIFVPYLIGHAIDLITDPFMGERLPVQLAWVFGVLAIVAPIGIFMLVKMAYLFIVKGTIE